MQELKRIQIDLTRAGLILLIVLTCGCAQQSVIDEDMLRVDGPLPADFSGYWQRNYARDDEVNAVLQQAYNKLSRTSSDQMNPRSIGPSPKDMASLLALARLAEEITRPDVLTISQNQHEVVVSRKDDYSMLCAFYSGVAKGIANDFGAEICGWDGNQLVSHLVLPDGLNVTHRFTISEDGQQLRVVTTVASRTSRVPFTLRRFYTKFDRLPPDYNCIETLSMKRVCSIGPVSP